MARFIKVKRFDWNAAFHFRPPTVDEALNLDDVSRIQTENSNRLGVHSIVHFKSGGKHWACEYIDPNTLIAGKAK